METCDMIAIMLYYNVSFILQDNNLSRQHFIAVNDVSVALVQYGTRRHISFTLSLGKSSSSGRTARGNNPPLSVVSLAFTGTDGAGTVATRTPQSDCSAMFRKTPIRPDNAAGWWSAFASEARCQQGEMSGGV